MTQQILFETTDVMRFTSQGARNYNIIDTSSFELNHDSDINREVFAYPRFLISQVINKNSKEEVRSSTNMQIYDWGRKVIIDHVQ